MASQGWGHPFPLEPIRDRYVTPFAGVTFELAPYEIGVNAAALSANTTLPADARVMVAVADGNGAMPRATPFLTRPTYRVVALDGRRPDALSLSPRGEVVFSTFEQEADSSLLPWLRRGDTVVLNAALARFPVDLRRPGEAI